MYRNFIRIIAVLFASFACCMALPGLYRMLPSSWHGDHRKISYSEVLGDFIISQHIYASDPSDRTAVRLQADDTRGNSYTSEQMDTLLLLENASQLIYEGRLPATICGVPVTPESVAAADYTIYFGDGSGRGYGLLDLKDKLSYQSRDYQTQDLFRFRADGIEFLDAPSNSVDVPKTAAFNRALAEAGFVAPATDAWTPSDRTDAETLGYFLTDSRGRLFRMGMCGGEPEVEPIPLPEGCGVRSLSFVDRPEFLAMLLTPEGAVYRLGRDYSLVKLPLPDTRGMRVSMRGTLLFNKFIYAYDNRTSCYVTDPGFRMLDSCTITHRSERETPKYKARQAVFPFTVRLTAWRGLRLTWSEGMLWLAVNLLLAAAMIAIKRRRREALNDPFVAIDVIVVAVLGIYGFLGVLMMPGLGTSGENRN